MPTQRTFFDPHTNFIVLHNHVHNHEPYPFGVVAEQKETTRSELHGPFKTFQDAQNHADYLSDEYTGYSQFKIVKIELPEVSA